uniref:Sperm microtubule inner protein 4 n=1 Tax=Astyanax mexicanus TaxID=7994 RepID=A0A3B1J972_ASTMX
MSNKNMNTTQGLNNRYMLLQPETVLKKKLSLTLYLQKKMTVYGAGRIGLGQNVHGLEPGRLAFFGPDLSYSVHSFRFVYYNHCLNILLFCIFSLCVPRSVSIAQYYDITPTKRSNVRTNDELEKTIKVSIQREHPYQSHISRCAMFPNYRSPDDPNTGVRASNKLPLNPLLPASAPQVTVLSKTKGGPYRHELLDVPMETRRTGTVWPGQNGFKNVSNIKKEFYPKTPKTLCPNLTLRDWKTTLSERTANMLRNVEKSQWLTSYQLHFTGTVHHMTGSLHKERSCPTFLPPRPLEGRKARILQDRRPLEGRYPSSSPSSAAGKTPIQDDTSRKWSVGLPQNANVEHEVHRAIKANESIHPIYSSEFYSESYVCDRCWERNCMCTVRLSEPNSDTNAGSFLPQNTFQPALQEKNSKEGLRGLFRKVQKYMGKKNPFELSQLPQSDEDATDRYIRLGRPTNHWFKSESEKEEERVKVVSRTSVSIQPRSSSAPYSYGERPNSRTDDNGPFRSQSVLLDLQDSFSQTEAHRRFHETLQGASMDLRDNHHTGRKHCFYGFNSYYYHN